MIKTYRSRALSGLIIAMAAMIAGCAAPFHAICTAAPPPRAWSPVRLPAPLTDEERQHLTALNQQVLREQEQVIASQQQAEAWARAAYAYPTQTGVCTTADGAVATGVAAWESARPAGAGVVTRTAPRTGGDSEEIETAPQECANATDLQSRSRIDSE
jgi:hypothetical protein